MHIAWQQRHCRQLPGQLHAHALLNAPQHGGSHLWRLAQVQVIVQVWVAGGCQLPQEL